MKKVAIFASGSGSNAQRLMEHFKLHDRVEIALVLTNNPDAYVLQRADNFEIPTHIFTSEELIDPQGVLKILKNMNIQLVVLAGFLKLIPSTIINEFQGKIINIHPALLPKYGGKGMYGMNIHKKVLENKEKETGITIHHVNEQYDKGDIIYQHKIEITPDLTPELLNYKIHQLEHQYLPKVVEELLK